MTSTAPEPTRREVGGYQLLTRIGEGGMGVVYLARRPGGPRVALKLLRPHVVGDDEARARLAREVNSLSRVRSARVAEIVDADPFGETPFVATRYVPGLSLHDHVRDEGVVAGRDLTWFAYCLADALAAVHRVDVLHRDVKPSNVLMEGRSPVLIDFGLARLADDPKLTYTGWLLGTPGYLAPEILYGADATAASDVHCWAATVAYAGTGRPPFGRGPSAAVMDRVRRGEHDLSGLPHGMATALDAALSPDPGARPPLPVLLDWLHGQVPGPSGTDGPGSNGRPVLPPPLTMPIAAARHTRNPDTGRPDAPTTPLTPGGRPVPHTRVLPEPAPTSPAAAPGQPRVVVPPSPVPAAHLGAPGPPVAWPNGSRAEPDQPMRPGGPVAPARGPVPAPGFSPAPPRVVNPAAERWRRRALLLGGLGAVAGALSAYPYLALTGLVVLVWLLRSLSRAAEALRERRRTRGRAWHDAPRALVSTPWHLLRAVPGTVVLVGWSAGIALAASLLCYAAGLDAAGTLGVTGATFAGGLWWGPGGVRVRGPVGAAIRPLARQSVSWAGVLVFLLAAAWVSATVAGEMGPNWAPATSPPGLDLPAWLTPR